MKNILLAVFACLILNACAPKVGSPEWCEKMEKKSKGDWTANEAKDYAKHCIFK
ncbi:hypothetical protein GCM10011613_23060 [Cellvibrio zantedeschiae]|uniref:DUF3012 domain-containing protein n=1 Tax=Cellvibrio zantedeschiae TaxID=1237077 RepID=A0ABQ3B371_9GAMM|nr:DUF3012 domain-containing protein [Cellvibrio zantedeschiae]GGY77861.1 hypothetical protein GCM10011613_23060 [Cellvibrio zantedeschiae]